jgi:hypothetical protein
MRALSLLVLVLISGCDDRPRLFVDVRTDLVPGSELVTLSAVVDGAEARRVSVDLATDWLVGGRVAELRVDPGTVTVVITGLDAEDQVVVERTVRVRVEVDIGVTVLLTRDCRGVVCDAANEACWAGGCVSDECSDQSLASCGAPECANASECPVAGPCGTARCELGACVYEAGGACGASEFCDPEFGCRTMGDTGPVDGLIAHYRFDDDPADGVLDSSGSGRHGACTICPALASGGPRGSYYLSFADDQLVTVPNDAVLGDLQEFTAAGWIRLDPGAGARSFFGKPLGTGSGNSWEFHVIEGVARFSSQSIDTTQSIPAMVTIEEGVWVHWAASFDGTTQIFYVDGVMQGMASAMPISYDDSPLALLADINVGNPASELYGGVDDLRLYDRALTADEVADLATR